MDVIESQDGHVTAHPAFDWTAAILAGIGVTALWTLGLAGLAFALEVEARNGRGVPTPGR